MKFIVQIILVPVCIKELLQWHQNPGLSWAHDRFLKIRTNHNLTKIVADLGGYMFPRVEPKIACPPPLPTVKI